jgi:hypothetical protein
VRGAVAPLVPQKESFLGGSFAFHGPIAQPPASILSRSVVARLTPPERAAPFALRQQAFATHPGQPLDEATLSNLRQSAPAVRAPVKVVTPGYPRKVVGQRSFLPQSRQGETNPGSLQVRPGPAMQPSRQPQATTRQLGPAMQQSRQQQPAARQQGPVMQPPRRSAPRSKLLLLPEDGQSIQ